MKMVLVVLKKASYHLFQRLDFIDVYSQMQFTVKKKVLLQTHKKHQAMNVEKEKEPREGKCK